MKSKITPKEKNGQVDFVLLFIIMSIMLFGFVMLFSANAPKAAGGGIYGILLRQGLIFAAGIAMLIFSLKWDYHIYSPHRKKILVITLVIMAAVPAIGFVSHGATRQISLGFISFQPSEFAKVAMVLYYASFLSNPKTQNITNDRSNMLKAFGVLGAICFTCYMQSHLSATVVIALIIALMLFISGLSYRLIGIGAIVAVAFLFFATKTGYRSDRLLALADPFKYKQGIGWQIVQSLFAVGSGGMFGLGLGQSRQKYNYLPEAQNDYIYAIVCEELGFIGGITVIILFVLFVWRGMTIALKAKDKLGMLTAFGITSIIGLQMLINIGVVLSVIPSTGMQLPLFSSGGSSMLATMWGMGILLNISKTSRIKKI